MFVEMNGTEVRNLRRAQGLSKRALAKKASVTEATLARAEDSQKMHPDTARKIAKAVGIPDARSLASRSK